MTSLSADRVFELTKAAIGDIETAMDMLNNLRADIGSSPLRDHNIDILTTIASDLRDVGAFIETVATACENAVKP